MILVMLHGWGFDRHFWQPLQSRLGGTAWDLGYYGEEMMPLPEGPAIAVGHSYGVLWLLKHRPFAWKGLISINGFSRFAAGADFPEGVPPAQIDRLSAEVGKAPHAAVHAFRQRCGDQGVPPDSIREASLQASLDHLRHWDQRGNGVDLALCGERDKVVPPALSRACFTAESTLWHEGGHLLPLQDPDWCAFHIRRFIEERA
jgi:pimeloyl-[acyl-carrier protein] methyl ester esterase